MGGFKRNQLEDAICSIKGGKRSQLLTEIKRLLDTDRHLVPKRGEKFAFFSEEGSGRGNETWFSEYEAFAVLLALNLLHHGFPQQTCVEIMRSLRGDLESRHRSILRRPPEPQFDDKGARKSAKPGDLAVATANPVFVVVVYASPGRGQRGAVLQTAVRAGADKAMQYSMTGRIAGEAWTLMEIAELARRFRAQLRSTEPKRRGRPGGSTK